MNCQICGSHKHCVHAANHKSNLLKISLGEEIKSYTDGSIEIIQSDKIIQITQNANDSELHNDSSTEKESKMKMVRCEECKMSVSQQFITKHMLQHFERGHNNQLSNVERKDASTALVIYPEQFSKRASSGSTTENVERESSESLEKEEDKTPKVERTFQEIKDFLLTSPDVYLHDEEIFNFKLVKDVSWTAATSSNKRYSDLSLIIWMSDQYLPITGAHFGASPDVRHISSNRIHIYIVYDSVERLFLISSKLLKRKSSDTFDIEDGSSPERICEQNELLEEIQGILLFFGISPRDVYRHFRRILNDDILLETDKENKLLFTTSINFRSLFEDIKPIPLSEEEKERFKNNKNFQYPYGYGELD